MKNRLKKNVRWGVVLLFVILAATQVLPAQEAESAKEPGVLFDREKPKKKIIFPSVGSENDVELEVTPEGVAVKIKASGSAGFPGITMKPNRPWKLSDYTQIDAVITNTSASALRLNMRVDNEVPKVSDAWNANAIGLKPGETKTLTVVFGQSYNHPGYALNPKEIVQLLIFAGPSSEEQSFRIESVKAAGEKGGSTEK
jgi:hypothetical protein